MDIYCNTHKRMDFIEELKLIPVAVGETECPKHYINEKYKLPEGRYYIRNLLQRK